ncbi:beta-ketoacyl synthase N-terminal-like domain-containing protein [Actinoplanes sp. NPDC049548]|uniref:beta-ketoacyl synthase N-terminal-like domain-containing protein n=1 Tax=Actinoplanes sp. NPDC049548 TaxID=3155152 RepID=UPI00343FC447
MTDAVTDGRIAVIGLHCRFPGADGHEQFWANLRAGVESVAEPGDADLEAAGVPDRLRRDPRYVNRAAVVEDADAFDASFFYLSSREAERMDPQLRLFLQSAWSALEHSGHDSESYPGRIGVFAGSLASTYLLGNVLTGEQGFAGDLDRMRGDLATLMGNDPNYLATRTSYHLNLTGPSISVQTACSTSLVAVHVAAQSLLAGECDVALAGGVAVRFPQQAGYLAEPDAITSTGGRVRPFDADADGTIFGNGVGTVVLKRLDDAIADGDTVWAVVLGSAVGNDGADRAGFSAPGVSGQAATLAEALSVAGVDPATVGYVEAHGTGTRMGDPIEFEALRQAYGEPQGVPCALGSVKGNIGHLSVAAGIAGFLKTVLMLHHGELVPTLHFRRWNPECGAEESRFWVPVEPAPWPGQNGVVRRAAVTSTGMGGTTAHVVLEQSPAAAPRADGRPLTLLPVSAKSPAALETARRRLADHLRTTGVAIADAGYTLATGRRTFNYRTVAVAADRDSAAAALEGTDPRHAHHDSGQPTDRPVVFMFPGQGTQYAGMGRDWYRHEPEFRAALDECAAVLAPDLDLRALLFGSDGEPADLSRTRLTQPAVFAVSYALARQWLAWGVRPAAMIGHSVGEYVAACLAGVFTLPDALRLVAARGGLVDGLPGGQMAAVMLAPEELAPYLHADVSLAAVNEPGMCTVAGPAPAMRELLAALSADGIAARKVPTSHAFHSAMMDPAIEPLAELVAAVPRARPTIPFVSNVTGTWIRDDEAVSPAYWARHLRQPVLFAAGLSTLFAEPDHVFLEVGPGQTLANFARRHPDRETGVTVVSSGGRTRDPAADHEALLLALGRLWAAGLPVDWAGFHAGQARGRVPLPTYPFEGTRYWIEPGRGVLTSATAAPGKLPLERWFSVPVWKQVYGTAENPDSPAEPVLLFADPDGVADTLAGDAPVIRVRAAQAFRRTADGDYEVRPDSEEDAAALVGDLIAGDRLPGRVLHCWSAAPLPGEPGVERFEQVQRLGLYSLIALVKAFNRHDVTTPVALDVVSAGAYAVTDAEPDPVAERVTLAVAAKVIGQEIGHLRCRHVDLPVQPDARSLRTLAAELGRRRRPAVAVAVRGGTRWEMDLEPLRVDWDAPRTDRLRRGGVYLITGGLGEIGTTIGEMLAREYGARLALLNRDPLPERVDWDEWLDSRPDDDETAMRIRRVRRLEKAGAEILLVTADIADERATRSAVEQVEAHFGALHGVVHAAGLPGEKWDRAVTAASVQQCGWHFTAKAHGQIVLERVLAGRDLDFCLLLSSLAGVLGGLRLLGYGAANHFMDAAAQRANRHRDRTVWLSVGWDVWQHHQDEKRALSAIGRSMDDKAIQPEEGLEAIRRLLGLTDVSHVAVSTWDLGHRLDQWVRREPDARPREAPEADAGGDLAEMVHRMVADAVGDPQLPAGADIFEHGGDSLLIVRLLSEIRTVFGVDVPLADVLTHPTAAALADQVAARKAAAEPDSEVDSLLAELSHLPAEEIEQLLAQTEGNR